MGGVIAFEMAQQLRAAGESVALLALIESYTPRVLASLDAPASRVPEDVVDPIARRRLTAVLEANLQALHSYRPRPYDGPITLFAAREIQLPAATRGWSDLAKGGLTLHEVPGDHDSILEPPHLDHLARILTGYLLGARALRPKPTEELK